jgi:hypothetical protein
MLSRLTSVSEKRRSYEHISTAIMTRHRDISRMIEFKLNILLHNLLVVDGVADINVGREGE